MRLSSLLAIMSLSAACDSVDSGGDTKGGSAAAGVTLSEQDFDAAWIRLPLPAGDSLGQRETLIATDRGYAALYRRQLGEAKVSAGWENRVFVSNDGVQWTEHAVPLASSSMFYRDMAFGNGRFVIAGEESVASAVATSSDAVEWTRGTALAEPVFAIDFANQRFFALSARQSISTSNDGSTWTSAQTDTVQLSALAFGNGTYVAVGSGPIQVSHEGTSWRPVSLDCAVPGNCLTDPSGGVHQSYTSHIFFAENAFHADALVSRDAQSWERIQDEQFVPTGYQGGYFLRLYPTTLEAWQADQTHFHHLELRDHSDSDPDCETGRCIIVGTELLLVPDP